jgi:predicted nucleic acid-binding protein
LICVDASLAAKWVLAEEDSDSAEGFYLAHRGEGIIAPSFMPAEVTNAIWRKVVRNLLDLTEARAALNTFLAFEVELAAHPDIYRTALSLAEQFQPRAAYDMHYVALAQIAGCELWTADQRLLNALGGRLPFVRPLAEFQA